nr:NAD kinase [Nocardioides convexus]
MIGGDGSILRAAEVTHESLTPVLGVNLGHVGFLAEAEHEDVAATIDAIVQQRYTTEDRLTLAVRAFVGGEEVYSTFAVNEASVEKAARERMLEVVVEIDSRPLSRWGCDGVVCATPTGSTAYNFSAGGPVVWPQVEALCIVPLSAHALFARPMVVAPSSVIAIEVLEGNQGSGVLWCDGRRSVDLPPGARIEVSRGQRPVRLVRLHEAPFTDRLVAKFGLSVEGWRGAAEPAPRGTRPWAGGACRDRGACGSGSLGVIDASVLEARARPDRDHRRDRCRQDDGGDRARPAPGRPGRQRRGPGGCQAGAGGGLDRGAGRAGPGRRGRGRRRRGRGRRHRARAQRERRGPVPGVRGRCRGAGLHAGRDRRAAGGGARPVRPAPAAQAADPAARAGPVRGPRRPAQPVRRPARRTREHRAGAWSR